MTRISNLHKAAMVELRKQGNSATREAVTRVVASMVSAGVSSFSKEEDIDRVARIAANSYSKFKGTNLLAVKKTASVVENTKHNPSGTTCPRCHLPMVVVDTKTRPVSYCTNGCRIALPFEVN